MWWRYAACGYTDVLAEAGKYTEEEACRIVCDANINIGCKPFAEVGKTLNEAMVPVQGD